MVLAMEQLNEDQKNISQAKKEFADSVTSTETVTNASQKRRNKDEGILILHIQKRKTVKKIPLKFF